MSSIAVVPPYVPAIGLIAALVFLWFALNIGKRW